MRQFLAYRYTRSNIAYLVVIFAFLFLFGIVFLPIPKANQVNAQSAVAPVLGFVTFVLGYYMGSSKDKSDQEQSKIYTNPPNP